LRRHAESLDRFGAAASSRFIAIDGKTLRQSFDDSPAAMPRTRSIILAHEVNANAIPAARTPIAVAAMRAPNCSEPGRLLLPRKIGSLLVALAITIAQPQGGNARISLHDSRNLREIVRKIGVS
jgi:hypothetical protein